MCDRAFVKEYAKRRARMEETMFTGIIEEMGTIESVRKGTRSAVLGIRCSRVLEGTKIGDSIAVNGVCLTVTGLSGHGYTADVMAETMARSSLGMLAKNSRVNLERAMAAVWRPYRGGTYRRDRSGHGHYQR